MQAFIVTASDAIGSLVRQILLREGHDCPGANVVPLGSAAAVIGQARPDLVVLILSAETEHALSVLSALRASTPGHILAVGPAANSKLLLAALRGGAADYVEEMALDEELVTALRRLPAGTSGQAEAGRIITLLAPSGGSGSSTLAVNLATVLAKQHQRALLLDLKLESGDLAALLDLQPTHTLAELCQNAARLDRVMFEGSLAPHASGVRLLAPPRSFADIGHVTPEGVRQALTMAKALFPYVLVDLDHSFREEQLQALLHADVILVVVRLDFAALHNAQKTLVYLNQRGIDRDRIRLVVNRYGQPKEVPAAKAEKALGVKFAHYVPNDPKTVNLANNNGVPVVLEAPSSRVAKSLTQLAISVNGRHQRS